jgi:predicted RNase H-like nuclease (RuvC/YqgF family)
VKHLATIAERLAVVQAYCESIQDDLRRLDEYRKAVTKLEVQVQQLQKENAKIWKSCDNLIKYAEALRNTITKTRKNEKRIDALSKMLSTYPEIEDTYKQTKTQIIKWIVAIGVTALASGGIGATVISVLPKILG